MNSRCKQTNDYNCGPTALSYFLRQHGIRYEIDYLEKALLTTPEHGTSHDAIQSFLYAIEFPFISGDLRFSAMHLPMLVNYWKKDDGHYGVIIELHIEARSSLVALFDPEDGRKHLMDVSDFRRNWYSKRYGKNWGLCKQ
jgi:ABC-type bacteriocin/lantibiotic exporter with double-glycine peptidase domain